MSISKYLTCTCIYCRKLKDNKENKNGTLDLILRLVRDGIFPIDQVQTHLETIIKTQQQLKRKLDQTNNHSKESCQKESQKILKVWCEEKEEDYEGEKMDPMKEEGVHTDLDPMKEEVVQFNMDQMTDSCVKDKIDKILKLKTDDTKETLAVKEKCLVVECNGDVLKDEIESDKAEILLKLESCTSCKELEKQFTKSKKQSKSSGKVSLLC